MVMLVVVQSLGTLPLPVVTLPTVPLPPKSTVHLALTLDFTVSIASVVLADSSTLNLLKI